MCTVIVSNDPGRPWPLLIAANRDERLDRPWQAPGRHWPEQPNIVGGRDGLGGGSWLAVNDCGVAAAVANAVAAAAAAAWGGPLMATCYLSELRDPPFRFIYRFANTIRVG